MRYTFTILTVFIALAISSCKTSKTAQSSKTQFSAAEYPYIEKFHEGIRLKLRGQVDEAIAKFEECLKIKQTDDAVYYALSELYLMKKNQEKSIEYILQAAKLDPKNIWYTQELAYMYFERQNYQEAVKNFEKLVKYEPRNVEWLYGYAECLVRTGKTSEAIKALDKTEDQVGKHPDLSVQKFNLYLKIKQPEKALQEIESARKVFPSDPQLIGTLVDYYFQIGQEAKAVKMLEELVVASPLNGRAHLALADIYRQKGKMKMAYEQLTLAFMSPDIDLDTKMKILISIHESSTFIDPEVYALVDLVVAQYPNEAKAYSIQGDYYLRADRELDALGAYRKALEFDKNQYPIWNQVMIMEYQNGMFEELYKDSKECLEYFPAFSTVYLLNAVSAVQLKKYQEAIDAIMIGKELVGSDKAMEAEMYGQLGEAQFGLKKIEEGKKSFEQAIKLDGKSNLLKNNYAYNLALSKVDLSRAMTLIDQVLALYPNDARYLDTKGFILFQQEKYKDAQSHFEQAVQTAPKDKVIVEHLGDVFSKLGDKDKAVKFWLQAKELGSTNKMLDKKIEKKEYYEPVY